MRWKGRGRAGSQLPQCSDRLRRPGRLPGPARPRLLPCPRPCPCAGRTATPSRPEPPSSAPWYPQPTPYPPGHPARSRLPRPRRHGPHSPPYSGALEPVALRYPVPWRAPEGSARVQVLLTVSPTRVPTRSPPGSPSGCPTAAWCSVPRLRRAGPARWCSARRRPANRRPRNRIRYRNRSPNPSTMREAMWGPMREGPGPRVPPPPYRHTRRAKGRQVRHRSPTNSYAPCTPRSAGSSERTCGRSANAPGSSSTPGTERTHHTRH